MIDATSPIRPTPPIPPKSCIRPCPKYVKFFYAGPITGCGDLMNFGNPCFMANYNCQNLGGIRKLTKL